MANHQSEISFFKTLANNRYLCPNFKRGVSGLKFYSFQEIHGFDETYKMMGVSFDKIYYESNTYLEGKEKVMEGLEKGFFYRKEDVYKRQE